MILHSVHSISGIRLKILVSELISINLKAFKTNLRLIFGLFICFYLHLQSFGQITIIEDFDYGASAGNLAGQNGGSGFATAWAGGTGGYTPTGLSFGAMSSPGGAHNSAGFSRQITTGFAASGPVSGSFLFQMTSPTSSVQMLGLGTSGSWNNQNHYIGLMPANDGQAGKPALGIRGTGISSMTGGASLTQGTTYMYAFSYDNGSTSAWILSLSQYINFYNGTTLDQTAMNAAPIGTGPTDITGKVTIATSASNLATMNNIYTYWFGGGSMTIDRIRMSGTAALMDLEPALAGASLNFDGVDDYVNVGDVDALDGITQFTLEAWVYRTASPSYTPIIVKTDASFNYATQLSGYVNNTFVCRITNNGDAFATTPSGSFPANTWTHVAAVYDGTASGNANRLKIYVNGVAQTLSFAGNPIPPMTSSTSENVEIGRIAITSDYFPGTIDEVRIWTTARTCDQIFQLRNCELMGNESGLLAYYKFNQGVANENNSGVTILTDAAGGDQNGTLSGFALTGATSNWVDPGGVTSGTSCAPVTSPEINVQGNSTSIADGNTTPSFADHTDFAYVANGYNIVRTFTIQNTGTGAMNVTGITAVGGDAGMFSIGALSPASPIPAGGSATFTVTYTPTGTGLKSTTLHIASNDCNEADYDFVVRGNTGPNIILDFGGIPNGVIGNYYNGGAGPNYGITFNPGIANNNGLSESSNPLVNFPAGFTTSFSVYGNVLIGFQVRVFDGLDGTGTQLGMAEYVGGPGAVVTVNFCGTGRSVSVARYSQPNAGYDDLTFGPAPVPVPEIDVQGGSPLVTINDGDITPSTTDHTDFGNVGVNGSLARSYTIFNTGNAALTISSITSNNTRFVVSGAPTSVAANSSATFIVTFSPTALGVQNATITINNNDCNEAVYDFSVTGTGVCLAPTFTTCPTAQSANTAAGTCAAVVTYTIVAAGAPAPALNYSFTGATTGSGSGNGSGSTFNKGVTNVTITATNSCGSETCSFTVTVTDNETPNVTACFGTNISAFGQATGNSFTTPANSVYQSFTAPVTGVITSIQIQLSGGASGLILRVGNGISCGGTILGSKTFNGVGGLQTITFDTPIPVTGSVMYNFGIIGNHSAGWNTVGSYPGGQMYYNGCPGSPALPNSDLVFTVNMNYVPPISINVALGTCAQTYEIPAPTLSDNCNGPLTWNATFSGNMNGNPTNLTGLADGSPTGMISFSKGTTNVVLNGVDANGNVSTTTCPFTVTVVDNEKPQITCSGPVNINTTAGLCTGTTTLVAPTFTDNCPDIITTGNGIHCDGINDYLESSPLALGTNDFTIECWVKQTSLGNYPVLFAQDQAGVGAPAFRMEVTNGSNTLLFVMADASSSVAYNSTVALPLNVWTHVAIVRSGNTYTTYLNGIASGSATSGGNINQSSNAFDFRIGARRYDGLGGPGNPFEGTFDDFRVWNTARTGSQIQASMNYELQGNESGLTRYYKFNQGNAGLNNAGLTTATATIGVNATLYNFALSGSTSNWVGGAASNFIGTTLTNNAPTMYPVGLTTVTWTATDFSGNTQTCEQTVTVVDNQAPENIVIADAISICSFTVTPPTTTDNCAGVVTGMTNDPLTYSEVGTYVVQWTFDDGNGNTRMVNQNVIINGPDADVFGNAVEIYDGDNIPSSLDNTSMGSNMAGGSITKTFSIQNNGNQPLTITGITSDDAEFTIGMLPTSPVGPGMSVTFDVTFTTLTAGLKDATINIISNSCNEQPFDFKVEAMLGCPYPEFSFIGGSTTDPTDPNNPDNWLYGCIPPPNDPNVNITIMSGETFRATGILVGDIINNGTLKGNFTIQGNFINNGVFNPGN